MKFRQAKKIIMRERRKGIHGLYGWLLGPPQWMKAMKVYIHHRKKGNPNYVHFYESRGIIKELRRIYEKV